MSSRSQNSQAAESPRALGHFRVITFTWSPHDGWKASWGYPFAGRMQAVLSARTDLNRFAIVKQQAIAAVVDPQGELVWQGRADRGDVYLGHTDSEVSNGRTSRRSSGFSWARSWPWSVRHRRHRSSH